MELKNKVVVITGGASGLGRATADYFVQRGARVAIFDVNEDAGNTAVAELREDSALFCVTDVTSEESVAAAVEAVVEKFGAIHVNINCAGVPAPCKVLDRDGKATALKKFAFVVNVNLIGLFNVMSSCAEKMALNEPENGEERGSETVPVPRHWNRCSRVRFSTDPIVASSHTSFAETLHGRYNDRP